MSNKVVNYNGVAYNTTRLLGASSNAPKIMIPADALVVADECLMSEGSSTLVMKELDKYIVLIKDPTLVFSENNQCSLLSKIAVKNARDDNVYEETAARMFDRMNSNPRGPRYR